MCTPQSALQTCPAQRAVRLCRSQCVCLQNLGSEVAVKVDGKELEKDSETSIGPGTKIAFGEDAIFLARPSLPCAIWVTRCQL